MQRFSFNRTPPRLITAIKVERVLFEDLAELCFRTAVVTCVESDAAESNTRAGELRSTSEGVFEISDRARLIA